MTETYDPDLLVTFLAVAESGSFSEAARRRGLRQSTVSQHVRRLEAETRRRLFDRVRRAGRGPLLQRALGVIMLGAALRPGAAAGLAGVLTVFAGVLTVYVISDALSDAVAAHRVADQRGAALRARPCGQLTAGGGFAGSVDADEEGDFGRSGRR